MPILHGDFETFSTAPLKKCGGYRYALDPSTEILCFCWAVDDGEVYAWVPCIMNAQARAHGFPINAFWFYGRDVPAPLARAVAGGATFAAHNASFERAVWQSIVVKRHGGPPTHPKQFVCTAARASAAGLPRSLEGVGMALDTKQQKDTEGAKLLRKFAMPRKPSKNDSRTRTMPLDEPEDFKRLVHYCIQDVKTERDVDKIVPHLHPSEQRLFAFDMQVNERGILLDVPLVKKTKRIVESLEANIVKDVMERTKTKEFPNGIRPTQRDKMLAHLRAMGAELENLQADHVRKYMRDNADSLHPKVRDLLLLRIEAGKASTKKLASMLEYAWKDHRARGTLLYYGASTGRWCLAEDTPVLVRTPGAPGSNGRGRVRKIQSVLPTDQLWDGENWVAHEGVQAQGKKTVVEFDGVCATEDHYVWVDDKSKMRLGDAAELGIDVWQSWPTKSTLAPEPVKSLGKHGKTVKTYDIINAGPNNRFTLANGRVVSNSGKGIQPQNFIRGNLKYEEQLRVFELLEHDDHELIDLLYEWPISTISSCMRGFIIPTKGKIFRVVDYASIEARVLAWIAQEEWVLEAYIRGLDVYKLMASGVFKVEYDAVTSEQRRIGKNLTLGCGYGLGGAKFVAYSEKAGVEIEEAFAKEAVKAYRTKHKKIVQFWYDTERCAIQAVREQRSYENAVKLRNLKFYVEERWFCIELPSGRALRYYRPKVVPVEKFGEPALQLQFKSEFRGRMVSESTYGGKLTENIVQATARDVLVHGMFEAEKAGYRVIGTVHDEIITEQDPQAGSVHELEKIVCRLPSWASGLPVAAEGFESYRYRK